MPPNNKRKARVLTNLKISEVSSCDRGAGEGCRVVLTKRDRIFGGYPVPDLGKNLDVAEPDLSESDVGMPDEDDDERPDGDDPEETDDLERLRDAMKREDDMRDPMRRLKSLNAVQICKQMVAAESGFGLAESDLVSLIDNYAKAHGKSFVDIFTAQDETGLACRKAIEVCKHEQWASRTATMSKAAGMPGRATLTPRVTGGRNASES
jgi:hypothetical protein